MTDAAPDSAPAATHEGGASRSVVDLDDLLDPTFPIVAARAAHEKGGTEILVLRVGEVLAITDYFVIITATNPRLIRSVVQAVEDAVARAGGPRAKRLEGMQEAEWVLADHGTFVVHTFHTDSRRYYELERLWGDVPQVDWADGMPPIGDGSATPSD